MHINAARQVRAAVTAGPDGPSLKLGLYPAHAEAISVMVDLADDGSSSSADQVASFRRLRRQLATVVFTLSNGAAYRL